MYKLLSCGVIALLFIIPAHADTESEDVLEEIIVTAGFRETTLLQSAGSISVLDEQRIYDRAAWQISDILNTLPNVNYAYGGSRARFIQMRGIGELEQFVDPKHYPSVGILVDGMEIGTTATGAVLSDVQQVEVLRGPQGTRFGANALAGIINIQTQEPGESLNGSIRAGYGNRDSLQLNGVVGGPITDDLGGRIAIQRISSDGFIDNDFLNRNDTAGLEELSLHGKLILRGTGSNEIRLNGLYLNLNNGYDAFSLDNSRNTLSDEPGRDEQQTLGLSVQANWAITDALTLESQLGWSGNDESYGYDEDWVNPGFDMNAYSNTDNYNRERDVISFDTRLKSGAAAIPWVAGVYVQTRDESLSRQYYGPFSSDYDTERYAAYGQIEYDFSDNWNLTTGLRLEHFRDDYNDSNALNTDSSDTYWSGDLTLEYRYDDDTLIYASLSRGSKPGGVNTDISSNQANVSDPFKPFLTARLRFDTESLFNKELGIKGRYLQQRLALRLALFHSNRNNAQLESWVWDGTNFIWTGMLDSSSDAQNYGAELELDYRLNDKVSAFAALALLQTNVDQLTTFNLDTGQFVVKQDRDQAKSPTWQYNVGLSFDLLPNLHGRVEVEGRDNSYYGYYHDGKLDSFTLAHASLSYRIDAIRIQGWIRNIFNEDYAVHGLYVAADPRDGQYGFAVNRTYTQLGEARAYGFNISYTF